MPMALSSRRLLDMPADGPLTNEALMRAFGRHMPEDTIISDKSLTAG